MKLTKQELDAMIREVVGDALADMRKEMEETRRRWADKIVSTNPPTNDGFKAVPENDRRGIRAARFLRALAAGKGDPDRAVKVAKNWLDRTKSSLDEEIVKALGESATETGGAIVPDEYVAEVIDLLSARAVVRSLGAQVVPMNSGSMTMPYLATGSTAEYVGENQNIQVTQPSFGQLQLSAKKLAALVPISNDLLRDASPRADVIVRNDLVRSMALREDLAFIRDDGTANKPKGMRYWADPDHVFTRTKEGTSVTLDEVTADLARAIQLLEEANVPLERAGWIFTPRTKWFLMKLRDGNGNLVFKPEMDQGTLFGFPYRTTTQIPNNLGTGGNESEVYFADFGSLIIAENTQLMVDVFDGGAYFDGSQVVSGISTDQTILRAIARHDFGARYRGKEIAVITGVDWGAVNAGGGGEGQ